MILNHICSRFKALILGCLAVVNRAMCCFSRKRRNSFSDCEVLQSVNVVQSDFSSKKRSEVSLIVILQNCAITTKYPISHQHQNDRDWNSWDDSPRTVDEHIEHYRQKLVQPPPADTKEPAIDFFQVSEINKTLTMHLFGIII